MSSPFLKFNVFPKALAEKTHNLAADTLKVMLTNVAPVATNTKKADLTEIAAEHGYVAGGNAAACSSSTQTSGVYKLVLDDPATWTAVGGTFGPFRYAVLYNDSDVVTHKGLIGYWDYGNPVTVLEGETFKCDFSPTNGVLTLS